MTTEFCLPDDDGDREVTFTGELLGSATSDDGRAQRWTIFEMYRTDSQKYVLHKVGRSVVYHSAESRCTRQAELVTIDSLLQRDEETAERQYDWTVRSSDEMGPPIERVPCLRCSPPDIYGPELAVDVSVRAERDRHSITVCETAQGVVDSLHGKDRSGTLFMTNVANRLLRDVGTVDPQIEKAWRSWRI